MWSIRKPGREMGLFRIAVGTIWAAARTAVKWSSFPYEHGHWEIVDNTIHLTLRLSCLEWPFPLAEPPEDISRWVWWG